MALCVGLVPHVAVAQIVQERLGAEGFPASWQASDFAIGREIISKTTASVAVSGNLIVSGSAPKVALAQTGVSGEVVEQLGVLKVGNGGFGPDLWQKSGRAEAETGVNRGVAQGVASPALREAWRRVLLTSAPPPTATDKGQRSSWLAVRGNALEKLGQYEAAWGLWKDVAPTALADDALVEGWVEAKLLAGQGNEACPVAKTKAVAAGSGASAGNWPVLMAVCQLVAPGGSNVASAGLSLQLVEPVLRGKNPGLLKILSAVQDGRPVMSIAGPTTMVDGLGGAVMAAYPALVGPDVLPRLPDVALRRLMASAQLPADLRGRAAVALARQTSLMQDGAAAWQLVSSTAFVGVLPDPVVVARGTRLVTETAVSEYVQAALRLGMVNEAARAMPDWQKITGLGTAEIRIRVQAQLVLAALQGKVDDGLWDSWLVAQALENQNGVRAAQRSLLAVEGLGVGVPARVWAQLRDRAVPVSTLVDPAWQRLLAGAVRDGDVAGGVGLIGEAWVGQPPAGVVPVVMGASVEALRRLGLEDVARRVAAEAMLGLPESHLIPLVPVQPVEVSVSQPVSIGADAAAPVSASESASGAAGGAAGGAAILPPPRVQAPKKPTVKMPVAPVAPKVGN